jgi:hypothetical protein
MASRNADARLLQCMNDFEGGAIRPMGHVHECDRRDNVSQWTIDENRGAAGFPEDLRPAGRCNAFEGGGTGILRIPNQDLERAAAERMLTAQGAARN